MSTGGQTGTLISSVTGTSQTAAIIETRVRQITKRDNTTELTSAEITSYTQESVREISARLLNLKSSTTGTLSASTNTITIPTDMVKSEAAIDELYLGDDKLDPITFAEWRAGRLEGYAYRNGVIYVSPTPNNDRAYTLYYSRYHVSDVTSIEFDDELKLAVVFAVAGKIYDDYEMFDQGEAMRRKYEHELDKHAPYEMVAVEIRHDSRE
jgi:hypothetical protein